jgi:hypothetical protein
MNSGRWWGLAVLVLGLAAGRAAADGPGPVVDPKAFDKLVVDSLKEVHNRGADLYNVGMDFGGAYRMYEGGLIAVRPLLGHRPNEQKLIEEGLAAAEKEPNAARKAFLLHEAIEKVRANLRVPLPEAKKPAGPGKGPGDVAKAGGGPGFRGKVTLKGQPLPAGDVILVSLDQPKPRVFTAAIQPDGQYAPTEAIAPGKYVVTVTGKGVPEKYQTTTTSPLRVEVKTPPTVFDIALE